jgi:ribonuclease VapC
MVVYGRLGPRAVILLDDILNMANFEIVAPGKAEMDAAWAAFILYGKGSGHPAGLNFGDIFSYAIAKIRRVPLLFKGNDFSNTDIQSAMTCDDLD